MPVGKAMSTRNVLMEKESYINSLEQALYMGRAKFIRTELPTDVPAGIEHHFDLFAVHQKYIEIAGWAFIRGEDSRNSRIFVVLESDRCYAFETLPVKRPDVSDHFKTGLLDDAGFSVLIPNVALPSGVYRVGLLIERNGSESLVFTDRTVTTHYWKDIGIPEVQFSSLAEEASPVRTIGDGGVDGNVSPRELEVISKITAFYRPATVFEIGTFNGRTTVNMAANSGEKSSVYTLDLPRAQKDFTELPVDPKEEKFIDKDSSGIQYKGTLYEDRIVQLLGDSAVFDFSPFINKMDLVFIDGSHAYEYVLKDTETAMGLLRDGKGIILWHDYEVWEGVTRAINELYLTEGIFKDLKRIEGTSLVLLKTG